MINASNSSWTGERVQQLSELWCSDLTPEAIANVMGGFDHTTDGGRKAVIGKANRLGLQPKRIKAVQPTAEELEALRLTRRARQAEREKLRTRSRGKTTSEHPKPEPLPAAAPFIGSLEIAFAELRPLRVAEPNQCRFIEGAGPDYLSCANETEPGRSYCGHHHGIVYRKAVIPSAQERDRRSAQMRKNLISAKSQRLNDFAPYSYSAGASA